MSAANFLRYLMNSVIIGGFMGAAHGLYRTTDVPDRRVQAVLLDGIQGIGAGPWLPIAVPLTVIGVLPSNCPYIRQKIRRPSKGQTE